MPKQIRRAAVQHMTRNANANANTTARNEQVANPTIVASLTGNVEAPHTTPTQDAAAKAAKAAAKEAEAQARKAAAERVKECNRNFDAVTMSPSEALHTVERNASQRIHEDGTTVGSFMAEYKLTKLTLKGLKAALPSDFVNADGQICMPGYKPVTAEVHVPGTDEPTEKKLYYCVVKGKGENARKVWKSAQLPTFEPITLWSPAVVRRLMQKACEYDAAKRAKRAEEMAAVKQLYFVADHTERVVNGKKNSSRTVVDTYLPVDMATVTF